MAQGGMQKDDHTNLAHEVKEADQPRFNTAKGCTSGKKATIKALMSAIPITISK